MAVCVDDARINWRGKKVCHLIADTPDELYDMTTRLGFPKPEWLQPSSPPHCLLSPAKRKLAIQYGAIEISRDEMVALIQRMREQEED